jgi:hypothetical protein
VASYNTQMSFLDLKGSVIRRLFSVSLSAGGILGILKQDVAMGPRFVLVTTVTGVSLVMVRLFSNYCCFEKSRIDSYTSGRLSLFKRLFDEQTGRRRRPYY